MDRKETIYANITGGGVSPVAIYRLSGPDCKKIVTRLCSRAEEILSNPRKAVLSELREGTDSAVVIYYKAPGSFTGEDVVEFNYHGSTYIASALAKEFSEVGALPAYPGEFSFRAFRNGKLDLTQTEAISDLIFAQTREQHLLAKRQLDGELRGAVEDVAEPLRQLLAEVEAWIDFPEEDIPAGKWSPVIESVTGKLRQYLRLFSGGKIIKDGFKVVLFGEPNAGKSSLLNKLAREERAIVTDVPGTTRDSIDVSLNLEGFLVRIWDTAGLREEGAGAIEELGIKKTREHIETADFKIFVHDATLNLNKELTSLADLVIANKSDLRRSEEFLAVSTVTGEGLEALTNKILEEVQGRTSGEAVLSNERHKLCVENALAALERLRADMELEIYALEVRAALVALEDIIGVTSTEDILGRIFSSFCIGK